MKRPCAQIGDLYGNAAKASHRSVSCRRLLMNLQRMSGLHRRARRWRHDIDRICSHVIWLRRKRGREMAQWAKSLTDKRLDVSYELRLPVMTWHQSRWMLYVENITNGVLCWQNGSRFPHCLYYRKRLDPLTVYFKLRMQNWHTIWKSIWVAISDCCYLSSTTISEIWRLRKIVLCNYLILLWHSRSSGCWSNFVVKLPTN